MSRTTDLENLKQQLQEAAPEIRGRAVGGVLGDMSKAELAEAAAVTSEAKRKEVVESLLPEGASVQWDPRLDGKDIRRIYLTVIWFLGGLAAAALAPVFHDQRVIAAMAS